LRTARNQFLITQEEQEKFYKATIGIAGLSVGSSAVNSIILSGGGGNLHIADNDTLAITNLNRLHSSVCDLGRNKAIIAARRVFEINPYNNITLFTDGLNFDNIDSFLNEKGEKLDVYIEEMDNIKLKIDSRFKARELGIPVVMASDNGDNAIIDVERFDLEPNRPLFHGSVAESILHNVPVQPSMAEKVRLADKIVGPNVTPRMQLSLTRVGTQLPAWPQLGNAATLSGVAVSYVVRQIVTGQEMPSGRYEVNLDALIDPTYHNEASINSRKQHTEDFIQGFKLLYGEKE
jgi:tRNA threonylcarbamoyladenosine dehydratase